MLITSIVFVFRRLKSPTQVPRVTRTDDAPTLHGRLVTLATAVWSRIIPESYISLRF